MVINLKVILREFLGLINLTKIQTFQIHKLTEVFMVSKDEVLVFTAFYIVMLSLKSLHNGQEFLIVDFITGLSRDHLSRKKGY